MSEPVLVPAPSPVQTGTGHPAVDQVLASLGDLVDRPVAGHVAVLEAAHERLRDLLTDSGTSAGTRSHPGPT